MNLRVEPVLLVLLGAALAQADEFQLSMNGVGPIVMETAIEVKGKTAEFTGTARNDSGLPIQRAEWCVQPAGQKECAFRLWTTSTWQPGETLKWHVAGKPAKGLPAHLVSLVSLQLAPEVAESRRQAARLAEEEAAAASRHEQDEKAVAARRELAGRISKAEAGDLEAQRWLAHAYDAEDGAPADLGEATRWCRKAAEQDDPWAELGLGFMYLNGRGVPTSGVEAAKWIDMAASQGYSQAQYWLARLYFNGIGIPQDYSRAHMWANLAASVGVKEALELRDAVAARLSPEQLASAQLLATTWQPRRTASGTPRTAGEPQWAPLGSGTPTAAQPQMDWSAENPACDQYWVRGTQFFQITNGEFRVRVALGADGSHFKAFIGVQNGSSIERLDVLPEHFSLQIIDPPSGGAESALPLEKVLVRRSLPKTLALATAAGINGYESASRRQTVAGTATVTDSNGNTSQVTIWEPDNTAAARQAQLEQQKRQDDAAMAAQNQSIEATALLPTTLLPKHAVSGFVYFNRDKNTRAVLLRLSIGATVYSFPYTEK